MNYVSKPVAGFYKRRMVRGGPWVGVKLWFGVPNDPLTGEPLDRSPRWQALVNGIDAEPYDAWIGACSNPITEDEYRRLIGVEEPQRPLNWKRGAPIF